MEKLQKNQDVILRVVAIAAFVFFAVKLFIYISDDYVSFIRQHSGWNTYFLSTFRFVCRVGFPVALVGLFFHKRWAAILLLSVWFLQLSFSITVFLSTYGDLLKSHYIWTVGFLLVSAFLYWCRDLFTGKFIKPIIFYLICAIIVHSGAYLFIRS